MAQNTTLLEDFGKKFFDTQKASNILCSVDFGKSLFKYINSFLIKFFSIAQTTLIFG